MNIPELKMPKNFLGKISSMFVDKYKVVYLIIITLLLSGGLSYMNIAKETVPDISLNYLYVATAFPGASAEDVESLITDPIEDAIQGLDGVDKITSDSQGNYSQIIVEFEEDFDMDQAEMDVNNKVDRITLPDGAMEPTVGIFETGEMPIFKLTVTGDYDLIALKSFAEDLQSQIEKVDGVRAVELSGGYEREIQIIVDFNRLAEYSMDINTLKNSLQAANINVPAGDTEIDGELLNVRIDESFSSIEQIENLMLLTSTGNTIFLKDVADVQDSYKTPDSYSDVYIADLGTAKSTPAVYLSIKRTNGYDIVQPCETIRNIVATAPGSLMPSDVNLIVTSDQSMDVTKDLSTVINNALGGLITVIIVLFIFIGLNEALIVSAVIPLSLLMTLVVMKEIGISLNTISLTGFIIALGLLVDNAIVVMENVDRLREQGANKIDAAKAGSNQVAPAVFSATLTTIGAFLPVAMTGGIMGKFLAVMPKTVIIIIAASFFMSIVITPALCARFLPKYKVNEKAKLLKSKRATILSILVIFLLSLFAFANSFHVELLTIGAACIFAGVYVAKLYFTRREHSDDYVGFIEKYKRYMFQLLKNRKQKILILIAVIAVFIGSIATIPTGILKLELFPYEEPSSINVNITAPVGTLLRDTRNITYQTESLLFKYSDIESFNTTIGGNGENEASISVELIDKEDRVLKNNDLIESLRKEVNEIPGANFEIEAVTSTHRMQSGKTISLGLMGDDMDELEIYANQYLEVLKGIDGVVEPGLSTEGGLKELSIDIDNNRAFVYGLNVGTIAQEIRNQISGSTVGVYKEDGEEYDLSIYYEEGRITSVENFDKINFLASDGSIVNFNEVATITLGQSSSLIQREDGKKVINVESDLVFGKNANMVNREFMNAVKDIQLPDDIEIKVGGEANDLNEQLGEMAKNFMIAMLLVYMILVIQFNSLMQPIVILLSVPFSIIGVIFGLVVTGNNLGFYAMFGIVALVGIAVNDAIVLIDYINYLRTEGVEKHEAISEAVKTRFQPVLATSLTTIGGVLPLALFNDTFSQLGFALIFGLIASTVLTLLIIPIVYNAVDNMSEKVSRKFSKE
ncbi:MAG: efflux RND transporter permease subunit [Clostridia bacterium]|nr:efflux RND transporter permease subunit [Clostridia bacterium]